MCIKALSVVVSMFYLFTLFISLLACHLAVADTVRPEIHLLLTTHLHARDSFLGILQLFGEIVLNFLKKVMLSLCKMQ